MNAITPETVAQELSAFSQDGFCRHEDVLSLILGLLKAVNYSERAALNSGKEKLAQKHYLIITIEEVLAVARANGWDLCKKNGMAYVFNGAYWQMIEMDSLRAFLGSCAEKLSIEHCTATYHKFQEELVKQFLVTAHFPTAKQSSAILINLENGTLEFGRGSYRLRPPCKDDFLTYQLPFAYDEQARCPKFAAFLNQVLPDQSCQHILSEYIGSLFVPTPLLKLEKVLLLYGSGANGKSVFFDIINALLGTENISHQTLQMLTDVERGGPYRAKLAGKLLNYGSEITTKMDVNMFKAIVSGEPIDARALYGQPFVIDKYARLIFNCNELPREVEHTDGFWRRLLIIPFMVTIADKDRDPGLSRKIIAGEMPGILNWALTGMQRLLVQQRFTESSTAHEVLTEFRKESDSVAMFIEEGGYKKSEDCMLLSALMNDYQTYCRTNGQHSCAKTTLSKRLNLLGFKKSRNKEGIIYYIEKEL